MRVRSRLCLAVADTRSGNFGEYSSLYYGGILHSFFGIWLRITRSWRDLVEDNPGLAAKPPPNRPPEPLSGRVVAGVFPGEVGFVLR